MRIKNLTKSYPGAAVFSNFSLEIEDGSVTCILGESGAGKTTLLNVIAGLTGYEGEVDRVKCSCIFQEPRLVPNLTVKKNLRLVCRDEARIAGMLGRVGLADKAGSYPVSLSGGQAQRVSLARAFLSPADVVLMDEPFSALDLRLKISMMDLFCRVRADEGGRTAVFVTHDVDEAVYLSDRVIVLSGGRVACDEENRRTARYGDDSSVRRALIAALLS